MKVLKSTTLKKRKCAFGNFELVAENGWKISQSFIDFESSLLIVSTSDENEENWQDTGFGSRIIPTKEYIIDSNTCEILPRAKWSKYFSYEPKEIISEDGKYKLVTTRVHDKVRDSDSIHEELIEIESNKVLSSGEGLAFRKEKRETALEQLYRTQKEHEKRKRELEAMPTLSEFFDKELKKITQGEVILEYYNSEHIFKLVYSNSLFELLKAHSTFSYNLDWNFINYVKKNTFSSIHEFVAEFFADKNWYLNYSPINLSRDRTKRNQLLKKFIVEFFNELREKHDFTYKEYDELQRWSNYFYEHDSVKPEEYKQYCSNCNKPVSYFPRYPKYICRDCSSKTITDEDGFELSFSNIDISGGLRVTYKKDGKIVKEGTSDWKKLCFIDGKRFVATEARFGGIVIQSEK